MNWFSPCQTTALGSLPYAQPAPALELIKKHTPYWPHWPQLPVETPEQFFSLQYVQPLLKLGLLEFNYPRDPFFTRACPDWDKKVVQFYDLYLRFCDNEPEAVAFFRLEGEAFSGLDAFLHNFALNFPQAEGVKGHLSGPLTVGLQIKDEQGRSCFYADELRDLLVKCLAVQGVMQVRRLAATGLPVLLFIDDPSINLVGAATHITLTREIVAAALEELLLPLQREGAKVGVHACSQIDWSILFALPLDLVSFDAFHFFPSMAIQATGLKEFLAKNGKLAWGIVPTSEEAWQVDITALTELFARQRQELQARGILPAQLTDSIIWTPSCGTGALPLPLAEHIYQLLGQCPQII